MPFRAAETYGNVLNEVKRYFQLLIGTRLREIREITRFYQINFQEKQHSLRVLIISKNILYIHKLSSTDLYLNIQYIK